MSALPCFFMLLLVSSAPLLSQPIPASVPPPDYAVYTAVTDYFTQGDHEGRPVARPLLLIVYHTVVPRPSGFDVDFRNLASRSLAPFPRTDSPLKTPEWTAFIASVDTSQFTRRRLERLPRIAGYKTTFGRKIQKKANGSRSNSPKINRNFAGYIAYSQVVYSADEQKAICYFSRVAGRENGSGSLVFLEKKIGHWQVVDALMLWIS